MDKFWAVLAYLNILFLIPLFAKRNSTFVQFHAKQGMKLFILWLIVNVLWMIPVIGYFVSWIVIPLGNLFVLIAIIMAIVSVMKNKMKPLLLIGKIYNV